MSSSAGLEKMKRLVEEHYDAAVNRQALELLDEQLTADFVDHGMPPGTPPGPGPVKSWLAGLKEAFPDLAVRTDQVVAEGDTVAVRASWTGTHEGAFQGVAPTGRTVSFSGAVFWRLKGTKLAERWSFIDRSALLRQLRGEPEGGQDG